MYTYIYIPSNFLNDHGLHWLEKFWLCEWICQGNTNSLLN